MITKIIHKKILFLKKIKTRKLSWFSTLKNLLMLNNFKLVKKKIRKRRTLKNNCKLNKYSIFLKLRRKKQAINIYLTSYSSFIN